MIKVLTAIAALAVGMPAIAGTAHDFDPSRVSTPQATLESQCYETRSTSKVCFFRLSGETYAVSINDPDLNSAYAEVFTVNCDTRQFRGMGPMSQQELSWASQAFCDSGRY